MPGRKDCIWLLLGARSGDNAQLRAIAAQLDLPVVEKQLTYNALHMVPNLFKGASLASLHPRARVEIKPPWPRMIIAVGKRSVPVARYIKQHSEGVTRLVHLGRPRANSDYFDLVVTTPQYALLKDDHVLELAVPPSGMMHVDVEATMSAGEKFTADRPRPFVVVLAGGNSTTATFTRQAAQDLVHLAQQRAQDMNGSLFLLTSPRTPQTVAQTLQEELKAPAVFIGWKKSDNAQASPYEAMLAVADEIIVTSDSASMIADGLALNKSVKVFQLPTGWLGSFSAGISTVFMKFDQLSAGKGIMILFFAPWRRLRQCGLINPPRRMALLIDRLFENALAEPFPPSERILSEVSKKTRFSATFKHMINRVRLLLKE